MTLNSGSRLGSYEIVSLLGSGGMGEVYRAKDLKLGRDVAIKVLREELASNPERLRRFEQEARSASALNHPNIITIYDIGKYEATPFIAMEYVEGKTLRETCSEGPLPTKKLLQLATQTAEGLAKAHSAGIVHRDLKPENLMVTIDGYVKILDFGPAKLMPESVDARSEMLTITKDGTSPGAVVGTVAYMSPEQAGGRKVDYRSDQFSLGLILYEIATGRIAFKRDTVAETLVAIIREEAQPIATVNPNLPAPLRWIVERCLAKGPEERYVSTSDLAKELQDLRDHLSEVPSEPKGVPPVRRRFFTRKGLLATAGLLGVVLALLFGLNVGGLGDRLLGEPGPAPIESLAVLPLENLSGDPEQDYFADGMTEALIADLAKIEALRVISRTSVMQYKGVKKPLREIASELDVDAVVEGSVLRSGDRVRITTQLVQAIPEQHLWADSYERDLQDILTLQSEVARGIAREVRVVVSPEEEKRLASTVTVDPEAHELLLRGRHFWSQGGLDNTRKAIDYYEKALEKDPEFALAYVGLAEAYVAGAHRGMPPSEAFPNARAAALKALEIDPTLAVAHAALADTKHHNWDWTGAERSFKQAIALNPGLEAVHTWYAGYLASVGQLDEAVVELKQAIRINPVLPGHVSFLGQMFYYARQYDQAIEQFRNALELNARHEESKMGIGLAYLQKSMYEEAAAVLEDTLASAGSVFYAKVGLAQVYAVQGRNSEARKLLEELVELSEKQYVPAHMVAIVYAALGEKDEAFLWLEKDYQIRDAELVWINVEPGFDPLRDDPRFQDLIRRMNFPN